MPRRRQFLLTALVLLPASIAFGLWQRLPSADQRSDPLPTPIPLESLGGMIRLPRGSFVMGSPQADETDAQPLHRVRLEAFWLDKTPLRIGNFNILSIRPPTKPRRNVEAAR